MLNLTEKRFLLKNALIVTASHSTANFGEKINVYFPFDTKVDNGNIVHIMMPTTTETGARPR